MAAMNDTIKADLLENAPVIIAFHDLEHNLFWVNAAYRKATGCSLEDIVGKKCYSVWGLSRPCRDCSVTSAIDTGEPAEAELTPRNQDHWPESQGSWLSTAAPIRNMDGEIIGAIEVAYNITERKKTEDDLRESSQRLEEVVKSRTAELTETNRCLLSEIDERELHGMIERHAALTGSPRAKEILSDWPRWKDLFLKVLPMEYRMILGQMTREDAETKREEKAKE